MPNSKIWMRSEIYFKSESGDDFGGGEGKLGVNDTHVELNVNDRTFKIPFSYFRVTDVGNYVTLFQIGSFLNGHRFIYNAKYNNYNFRITPKNGRNNMYLASKILGSEDLKNENLSYWGTLHLLVGVIIIFTVVASLVGLLNQAIGGILGILLGFIIPITYFETKTKSKISDVIKRHDIELSEQLRKNLELNRHGTRKTQRRRRRRRRR